LIVHTWNFNVAIVGDSLDNLDLTLELKIIGAKTIIV
jgi:hypothetical protein